MRRFFFWRRRDAETENGAPRFRKSTPSPKNKKAGIIRPFAIRYHTSASTSVVKGNAELQSD
ncbi:hypothetical protein CCGE531_01035 [Rhizobium sp. CCGE531]|nr:hypothetical protein CCGE531_01035 [Rhizobium sp. CCGE531]AYG71215.1 hypothetical protein CCGE532_01035 [Rhizobium sp. CCGE532]